VGHIIAGLIIRTQRVQPLQIDQVVSPADFSITDHPTLLLEPQKAQKAQN
jgi:hypothetical protein